MNQYLSLMHTRHALLLLSILFVSLNLSGQTQKKGFTETIKKHFKHYNDSETKNFKKYYTNNRNLTDGQLDSIKRFHIFLQNMAAAEIEQQKISGKATAGFNADRSGEQELINIDSGFELKKNKFPSEFEIKSSININVSNGTLQENLSDLELSYDNYIKERTETFLYLRRLSDKFMSIDNRYEVGAGVVLEERKRLQINDKFISGHTRSRTNEINAKKRKLYKLLTQKGKDELKKIESDSIQNKGWIKEHLKSLTDYEIHELLAFITKKRSDQVKYIQNEHRRFRYAWLFGVFAEVEQNSLNEIRNIPIELPDRAIDREIELKKTLDANTLGRFIIRPTFDFAGDDFTFKIRPYFKFPLAFWKSTEIATEENTSTTAYDWRFEGNAILSINGGPVSTNISYNYYFDNIPARDFIEPGMGIKSNEFVIANKHHHIIKLTFSYKIN